jgi:hypothetical protein
MARLLLATLAATLTLLGSASPALGAWTWPLRGELLTPYRNGTNPYAPGQHRGIDIAGPVGARVTAAADGLVRFAGVAGSSGLTVSVRTADGRFDLSYLHLSALGVRRGDSVAAGDRIGAVGVTGVRAAAAPHLHFGVRDAGTRHAYHDPLDFLRPPSPSPGRPPEPVPVPAPVPAAPRSAPAPAARSQHTRPLAQPAPALGPAPASAPHLPGHPSAPHPGGSPLPAAHATPPHRAPHGHPGRPAHASAQLGTPPRGAHAPAPAPPEAPRADRPHPDPGGIGAGRLVAVAGFAAAALLLSGSRRPRPSGRPRRLLSRERWRRPAGLGGRA